MQTLSQVKNLRLTEEVCKRIPNIKKLYLSYDSSGYNTSNLGRFTKLESLTLNGHGFLQSFTFPSWLQELEIWGYNFHWKDVGEIIKSLPNLGALRLSDVKGRKWSLVEVDLPRLRLLGICGCDLKYWNANSSHFPVLETLNLMFIQKLSEIPFDFGNIPTLAFIKLICCRMSVAISAMRILVEQQNLGNNDIQLHVYFSNVEEEERFQKMLQEEDLQSDSLHLTSMEGTLSKIENKKLKRF